MPAPYARLGRIVAVHGTRGEVTVALRDGLSSSVLVDRDLWVVPPPEAGAHARRVRSARESGKGAVLGIDGTDTAGAAHELVGRWLLGRSAEFPEAAAAADDLLGVSVIDTVRGPLGTVEDVIVTGANDVLVVRGETYGQVLIPVIPDVVLRVDIARGVMDVRLLEGLLEEDGS